MTTYWSGFFDEELEEILACLEDSDRYIHEGRKMRIIASLKQELVKRGHKQYSDKQVIGIDKQ